MTISRPHISNETKAMVTIYIRHLQEEIGAINVANGWRDRPAPEGGEVDRQVAILALITSEVSEAIEEIRSGRAVTETYFRDDGKPEGVPSELADVVIRALDFADSRGIDLAAAIRTKLDYNRTRGYRHGGKTI